jgi:NAD(P)-dependent dehydrogenase (short-subunit alcohol dehydrogenase family)
MATIAKKVVLITGASSGMGKETAIALAREGHIVYGAARRVDKMGALAQVGGHPVALDVTDEAQVRAVVQRVLEKAGRIDVLINNAGYGLYGAVEDTNLEDARRQFEVNVFGAATLTKAVLPSMRAQKGGRIINITSMGGKLHTPLGAWYHASKHALEGWSDCLRVETAQFGIDVVIVEPGMIETEFGSVVEHPMLERSGHTAYGPMARAVAQSVRATYGRGNSSPPSVIAATLSKAISAHRPKTRYVAGKFARLLLFMRRWLSDRAFDTLILFQVRGTK